MYMQMHVLTAHRVLSRLYIVMYHQGVAITYEYKYIYIGVFAAHWAQTKEWLFSSWHKLLEGSIQARSAGCPECDSVSDPL